MISFNGQYVCNLNVTQKNKEPSQMSFVKVDPHNEKDLSAVLHAVVGWKESTKVAKLFVQDMCDTYAFGKDEYISDCVYPDYYVATKQKNNFKNMESKDIVGVIQIEKLKHDLHKIKFFEVQPQYAHSNPDRKIKDIGRAMINAVKNIYKDSNIELFPNQKAIPFYKNEGFKEDGNKMVLDIDV